MIYFLSCDFCQGLVFVPDCGEFVVKGSKAMNRAVDGDLATWQENVCRKCHDNAMEHHGMTIKLSEHFVPFLRLFRI